MKKNYLILLNLLTFFQLSARGEITFQWLGTTNFILKDSKTTIMFDPAITRLTFWDFMPWKKVASNPNEVNYWLDKCGIKSLDGVLVNHAHTDHVIDAPYVTKKFNTKLYGSISVQNVGLGQGLTPEQVINIDESSTIQIGDFKISVFSTPHMPHFLDILLMDGKIESPLSAPASAWDYRVGEMYSFLIEHPEKKIFFQSIGHIYEEDTAKNVKADVLLLTIANRKTSNNLIDGRVLPTQAKTVIPLHHDNFFFPMKRNGEIDYFWGVDRTEFQESLTAKDKKIKLQWPLYCDVMPL